MSRLRSSSRSATIRFVFNVATLAGCVSTVIFALQPSLSAEAILLRSFVVFVVAALGTTLLLALVRQGRRGEAEEPVSDKPAAER